MNAQTNYILKMNFKKPNGLFIDRAVYKALSTINSGGLEADGSVFLHGMLRLR
jgi:hypothetical protein